MNAIDFRQKVDQMIDYANERGVKLSVVIEIFRTYKGADTITENDIISFISFAVRFDGYLDIHDVVKIVCRHCGCGIRDFEKASGTKGARGWVSWALSDLFGMSIGSIAKVLRVANASIDSNVNTKRYEIQNFPSKEKEALRIINKIKNRALVRQRNQNKRKIEMYV